MIGSILKVFFNYSYWLALLGQSLVAATQPFIINAITKVAAYWFRAESSATIVAIGNGFNLIGVLVGFVFFNLFISNNDEIEPFKLGMYNYLLWEAVLVCLLSLPTIIFMRNKPLHPPSLKFK